MTEQYIEKAIDLAKKYGIGKLYLIGSALYKPYEEINDFDFAIKDVPPGVFFKFYGELLQAMPKNVNLIDLSGKLTKFKIIIMREGKLIYDHSAA